jgi:hypothetical protein
MSVTTKSTAAPGATIAPRTRRELGRSRDLLPDAAAARWALIGLLCLAAGAYIWSRFIVLTQGLGGDEIHSAGIFINGGPSRIFDNSTWIPNDHMLFEVLSWATTGIIGSRTEATYRLWSVFPAMAAAILMTRWLWWRVDRWVALVFAVLATVSPLFFDLSTQARGYGIGFLAGVLLVIAADRLHRTETNRSFVMFSLAGLLGTLTLIDFVFPFLTVAGLLAVRPAVRRRLIVAVVVVGLVTFLWYLPVLSALLGWSGGFGQKLAWYGFVTQLLNDQFGIGIHDLFKPISATVGSAIAAVFILAGSISLWRRWERFLTALLLMPMLITYVAFDIGRLGIQPRFASFVLLPLIALLAAGIIAVGRWVSRNRGLAAATVALLVAASLLALVAFAKHVALAYAEEPLSAAQSVGTIVSESNFHGTIVSNTNESGYDFYLQPEHIQKYPLSQLERILYSDPVRLIYIQNVRAPSPDTTCLRQRGSARLEVRERRNGIVRVWLVPPLTGSGGG